MGNIEQNLQKLCHKSVEINGCVKNCSDRKYLIKHAHAFDKAKFYHMGSLLNIYDINS